MSFRTVRMLVLTLALLPPCFAWAEELKAIEPLISHNTRLMVFSPHPDDESLGAGGLIQRIIKAGGKVKVVFMTNGDGFPEGVEKEDRISRPTAKNYTMYGEERRIEALKADGVLGIKEHDVIFLGFPDGGLTYLRLKYRLHPVAYRSPFTRRTRPPSFEMIVPRTDYCGEDLRKEIERVMSEFRPNIVAVTPSYDWHPDHTSSYFFVTEALKHLEMTQSNLKPILLTFLIHYGQWPLDQGAGSGSHLSPPSNFPDDGQPWISFCLTPEEMEAKRKAILQYHSQMLVMGRFLLSFSRSNELYRLDPI